MKTKRSYLITSINAGYLGGYTLYLGGNKITGYLLSLDSQNELKR